ncbi:cadmium transporter [Bifidobacterium gallicum]|uniref:Cadmium transporter n=2 Tax=Bifidobacterium gallicum DSM 20093 = LMG 11596 TaxID=561180 RepID=A0A087AEL3_9BIFI|nr:cadmium transporter [Bifidobacterium gallicum]KFI57213.1 cadmium transporter [Bifidobacterium gallicum DSM 20093 = LMG 11596]
MNASTQLTKGSTTSERSSRMAVTRDERSGLPIMLVQAILVAAALCIGELISAPIYTTLQPGVFPLLPWAAVAMLLSVAFAYVVGFALLWCAESFAYRLNAKIQPLIYAIIGAIAFAVWTVWVVLGIMNSILVRVGEPALTSQATTTAAINGAVLGLCAFFVAVTITPRLAKYRIAAIIIGVVTVLLAVLGGMVLASMMAAVA